MQIMGCSQRWSFRRRLTQRPSRCGCTLQLAGRQITTALRPPPQSLAWALSLFRFQRVSPPSPVLRELLYPPGLRSVRDIAKNIRDIFSSILPDTTTTIIMPPKVQTKETGTLKQEAAAAATPATAQDRGGASTAAIAEPISAAAKADPEEEKDAANTLAANEKEKEDEFNKEEEEEGDFYDREEDEDHVHEERRTMTTDDVGRSKRVYVGNLAWQVSWFDLKDHMKSTGLDVTFAKIITGTDGRSRGCGLVEFASADEAEDAITTLSETELKGRPIFVREYREDKHSSFSSPNSGSGGGGGDGGMAPPPPESSSGSRGGFSTADDANVRRVYVGNLSWEVSWQELKDFMKQAGDVVHADIMTENSGRSKGCGIVEFVTAAGAQRAIETLNNTELKGRSIFVREDREAAVSSRGIVGSGGSTSSGGVGGGVGGGGGGARFQNNNRVYVWNLHPETSWQDLKDHMRKAGNVASATVRAVNPGQESTSGIVIYQRAHDAARAIRELQGTKLLGTSMSLREDRMHAGGDRGVSNYGGRGYSEGEFPLAGTSVTVGNLSANTSWQDLKDHFRQCGDIKRADVKKKSFQGVSKGFGVVQFARKEDADMAVSRLNGSELQGSKLEVRFDQKGHY